MLCYLYKKIQNISPESLNFQHSGLKLTTLGSDCASSKGYIVRWVEAPSNKLLTTAFEASLESVTVTCDTVVWVEDNICTYRYGEILHASAVLLKLFMSDRDYMSTGEDLHFLFRVCK